MPHLNPKFSRALLAALFLATGTLHVLNAAAFVRIVPPGFPDPPLLVAISGYCELAGALGLLVPATRRIAGYALIALLVAVYPANLYMAFDARSFADLAPPYLLWLRLPLQPALMFWIYKATA